MFNIFCKTALKNKVLVVDKHYLNKSFSKCCNILKLSYPKVANNLFLYLLKTVLKSFQEVRTIKREYAAVCYLIQRSGLTNLNQLHKAINARHFHTSPKLSQKPPEGEEDGKKKQNNNNEDKDKISTLLAKALLWMLTGYMAIAFISLMFPTTNQPEVHSFQKTYPIYF